MPKKRHVEMDLKNIVSMISHGFPGYKPPLCHNVPVFSLNFPIYSQGFPIFFYIMFHLSFHMFHGFLLFFHGFSNHNHIISRAVRPATPPRHGEQSVEFPVRGAELRDAGTIHRPRRGGSFTRL